MRPSLVKGVHPVLLRCDQGLFDACTQSCGLQVCVVFGNVAQTHILITNLLGTIGRLKLRTFCCICRLTLRKCMAPQQNIWELHISLKNNSPELAAQQELRMNSHRSSNTNAAGALGSAGNSLSDSRGCNPSRCRTIFIVFRNKLFPQNTSLPQCLYIRCPHGKKKNARERCQIPILRNVVNVLWLGHSFHTQGFGLIGAISGQLCLADSSLG